MKTIDRLYLCFALLCAALLFSGCTTFAKLDSQIPDGNWKRAHVKVVGEIVNADLTASGKKEGGKWVEGSVKGSYHGYFVKEAILELEVKEN